MEHTRSSIASRPEDSDERAGASAPGPETVVSEPHQGASAPTPSEAYMGAADLSRAAALALQANPLAPATTKPLRDARGRLVKGHTANRSGRPKGVAQLARAIQEQIGHDALLMYAARIWQNLAPVIGPDGFEVHDEDGVPLVQPGTYTEEQRWQAFVWLSERGYGKPIVAVDMRNMLAEDGVRDEGDAVDAIDDESLSDEEALVLESIARRRLGKSTRTRSAPTVTAAQVARAIEVSRIEPADVVEAEVVDEPEPVQPEPSSAPERYEHEVVRHYFEGSSSVQGFAWDPLTSELDVLFVNGSTYRYANVTREMVDEWIAAPSAGKWHGGRIRGKPDLYPSRAISKSEMR